MGLELRFFLVDVFAHGPLQGNPLAVVVDADELDEATMRRLAGEFNQTETTFTLRPSRPEATYRLRSYTAPGHEVFGAGHNALGAWWVLAAGGFVTSELSAATFQQEIGPRVLPVEVLFEAGQVRRIAMTHAPAAFGATVDDVGTLAEALGLERSDFGGTRLPAQVVSTGAAHCLVPVRDREAVDRARPDAARLHTLLRAAGGQGCYLFALDPLDAGTAYARFFNPVAGIAEDPATGSAAGPLAAQLRARRLVGEGTTVIVDQGHRMGRPSRIEVQLRGQEIRVLGSAVIVVEGALRV
jgi:trans-2,3-dihydro-3-hydroxyanthranilate isomerase